MEYRTIVFNLNSPVDIDEELSILIKTVWANGIKWMDIH
jgi:hypothetical protein